MTDYEYIPTLPYVLENTLTGDMMGRATSRLIAKNFSAGLAIKIIDTTPKPRVPEDAQFITWVHRNGERWYAESGKYGWVADSALYDSNPDALPGVTPDTVFTVLDERKS